MQLARTVAGTIDVDGMLEEMTPGQLAEWMEIYALDPWGEERKDLRAGIIASAAVAPYAKKGHTPRPSDFMPRFGEEARKPKQSLAEMKAHFYRAAKRWNKRSDDSGSGGR